jgi:MFS family permease
MSVEPPNSVLTAVPQDASKLPFRDRLFWFCLALSFLAGLAINVLPVSFKVFQKIFGAGYEMQGRIEAFYFVGALLGSLLAGYLSSRVSLKVSARLGLILGGLGCALIGASNRAETTQIGAMLMGMGATWLSIVYGAIVAAYFQSIRQRTFAAISLSMAIGGFISPLAVGVYVSRAWMAWSWPWWIPYFILAVLFFSLAAIAPTVPEKDHQQAGRPAPFRVLIRSGALWLIGCLMVLHGIGQVGAVTWLGRLYQSRLPLDESHVGMMISANLTGFILGRLFWTRCGDRLPDRIMLGVSAGIGASFYLLTILTHQFWLGLILIGIAGMGMSGDAISLNSLTAFQFRELAAKAFAVIQALGQMGAALGPYVIGYLGERSGTLQDGIWIIPVTIGSLSLIGFTWHWLKGRRLQPSRASW